MLIKLSLIILILCAFVLAGCNKSETHESTNANKPATSTSTPASASTTPASSSSTTAQKVGVPECDEFIEKYDACVSSKVPEGTRAQYRATINTWRTEWAKMANNPKTKPALAQACKMVIEQQRTAMKSYNCTF